MSIKCRPEVAIAGARFGEDDDASVLAGGSHLLVIGANRYRAGAGLRARAGKRWAEVGLLGRGGLVGWPFLIFFSPFLFSEIIHIF